MTDRPAALEQRTTLVFATGSGWADALARALPGQVDDGPVLLPSSLRRTDPLATSLRDVLRARHVPSHLLLPANPIAAVVGRARQSPGKEWSRTEIRPPDRPPIAIALPSRLIGSRSIWSVTDVDTVGGHGPYVLDLVARYLHPLARVRLLASPRRSDAVVEVNLAARPSRCLIGKDAPDGVIVAITDDPIAGELVALALADALLPSGRTATGPWEERVVQRATELQLGIQIPQQVAVTTAGTPTPEAFAVIQRATDRIGVTIA